MSEHHDTGELVPEDDAIIGRAFRWSLLAIVGVVVVASLTIWIFSGEAEAPPTQEIAEVAPVAPTRVAEPPEVTFTDITSGSGIGFVHESGAAGDKLLPETMGGGVAVLDYDGDDDADLLLVNGAKWTDGNGSRPATMALYRNDGNASFHDVTEETGLDVSFYGMGAAVGDYDNDGDPDVFITAVGSNRLFRNDGGVFRDVTTEAGVGGDTAEWSTSAGFFDAEGDGDLDLFVCNYVRWTRDIDFEVDYRLTGLGRAYGPPTNFEGTFPYVYRNDGDGTFTDVSADAGVQVTNSATGAPVAKSLGLTFVDFGGDGRLDIVVANDTVRNFLFRNTSTDGIEFEEVGVATGLAYGSMGNATGAMGIDAARYREQVDDAIGLAIGNFANEMSSLYVTQGDPWQFADEAIPEGVGAPSRQALSFGLFFFDYDLDGRLDLLQANGHLEDEINSIQPSQHYEQPAQLFWNAGPDSRFTFVQVPYDRTGDLATPVVGRGAAYADLDGDGDLDVVLTQIGGTPLVLRNDQNLHHDWLRVNLVGNGTTSNRDAIGTTVRLAGVERCVMPTRSYLSQVELPVTFAGLDPGPKVLDITWPDGTVQTVTVPDVDRMITVRQP